MKKILVTYNMFREGFVELESRYEVTYPAGEGGKDFTREEVMDSVQDFDALCPMFDFPVDRALIDRATRLQLIANYAVGYDNIDVAYALEKGLTIANTPGPTTAPTANLTLALLLDTARRVSECDRKLRTSATTLKVGLLEHPGLRVTGATLGIIGMGRIGKALCKRARACGMDVIYHNRRRLDLNEETTIEAMYVTMDELLEQSDFVSVNAPCTAETRHIIDREALKKMKRTAILINTSRGPLVDEKALVEALQRGEIQGAGLDVFEFGDRPSPELLAMDRVVLTPHIGTQTVYSRLEMAKAVSDNVIGFFEGDRPVSRVLRP
jgi:lactate dehydrogenase-like 2-hydroxyacid dehydrogenase